MKIVFIGGGNMAAALISGLSRGTTNGMRIHVADPNEKARARLSEQYGVTAHANATVAIEGADLIVLAVKPQIFDLVLEEIAGQVSINQCVVSIAAGITIDQIKQRLGDDVPVVRTMPNTPALLGAGITGLFASEDCSAQNKADADNVLAAAGATVWVPQEDLLNAVTAISGSGPAYYFLMTQALAEAGEAMGLDTVTANQLATHTAFGAGAMAKKEDVSVRELRRRVTSPGGTTQAAIETLQAGGFEALIADAANAACERGRELAKPVSTGNHKVGSE